MKSFKWTHDSQTFHGLETTVKNPVRGLIVIHGMGEHIDRYRPFFQALETSHIYAVGMDLRGHGQSLNDQAMGILKKTDTLPTMLADIHALYAAKKRAYPGLLFSLMGHSMGSVMARAYAAHYPDDFSHMIWMGTLPTYSFVMRKGTRGLSWFMGLLTPYKSRNRLLSKLLNDPLIRSVKAPQTRYDWLSFNVQNVTDYIQDPRCGYAYNSAFYIHFFQMVDGIMQSKTVQRTRLKRVLLISGSDDPVTHMGQAHRDVKALYQNAPQAMTFKDVIVPAMRHEPLNESDRDKVFNILIEDLLNAPTAGE